MGKSSGRWWGIAIAVVVVGALALYAVTSGGAGTPAAPSSPAEPSLNGFTGVPSPTATAKPAPALSGTEIAGLIVKIGVVAAVLGASLWVLRRYAGQRGRVQGRTGAVAIADTIPLAQGRAVYVLDVGDRALIVGATPQQLSLLAEISDDQTLARLRTVAERPASPIAALSGGLNLVVQAANVARARRINARGQFGLLDPEGQATGATPGMGGFTETFAAIDARDRAHSPRMHGEEPRTANDDFLPADRRAALAARLRALGG